MLCVSWLGKLTLGVALLSVVASFWVLPEPTPDENFLYQLARGISGMAWVLFCAARAGVKCAYSEEWLQCFAWAVREK